MEDFMCNVLIMGKTGTGKSTLLNYLCETDLAQTGTGKPVTEEGIYDYVVKIKGQEIRIFDSWGIEAGKVDRWKALIKNALSQHGVQCSIADWFHSVIYCVQAGGGRVEDIDIEIIRQFLSEGYKVTIVLTKADQVDEDEEAQMKNVIIKEVAHGLSCENLTVIATCAQEKKTRSGVTNPFGRDEVCKAILDGWKDTVMSRLPKHVVARICQVIETRMNTIKESALPRVQGLAENNTILYEEIEAQMQKVTEDLNDVVIPQILKEASEMCHKANVQLSVIFESPEVEFENTTKNLVEHKDPTKRNPWGTAATYAVVTFLGGLVGAGLTWGIRKLRDKRRQKEYQATLEAENNSVVNINRFREELATHIDQQAEEICLMFKNQEDKLANELEKSIQ